MKRRIFTIKATEEFGTKWSVFATYDGQLLDVLLGYIIEEVPGVFTVRDGLVVRHTTTFQSALGYFRRCY